MAISSITASAIIIQMPLGLYISVPFCKTKCSYCNFASGVFSRVVFDRYITRLCEEIEQTANTAEQVGGLLEREANSVYVGGGTPTLLEIAQVERLFVTISQNFEIKPEAEITVECAPGTLTEKIIDLFLRMGVNRVSLGVQSFVDKEAASVGRLHKRTTALQDIARLRAAGISNINVDLIAGLPHQSKESWQESLDHTIASAVPHVSVYMLEVDEDSRLGRELIAGGQKYHAHSVPDESLIADLYETACEQLNSAGILQYEISNFTRPGLESKHNLKYWTRQPYLGFGVDAHSMLQAKNGAGAVRFANPEILEKYLTGAALTNSFVTEQGELEESFFLGLRLNAGVDLAGLSTRFGEQAADRCFEVTADLVSAQLLKRKGNCIRLTPRGRLLSNEVFERFLLKEAAIALTQ